TTQSGIIFGLPVGIPSLSIASSPPFLYWRSHLCTVTRSRPQITLKCCTVSTCLLFSYIQRL
ncbi:hypothetical protein, partial [Tolypothrix sp. VBCCA 56010]|uniref:hypothetical protein n=1 Tax=Tolypothrix sp. VBCCA 56010 TaxID=3137731 RepID=UPI003D7D7D36